MLRTCFQITLLRVQQFSRKSFWGLVNKESHYSNGQKLKIKFKVNYLKMNQASERLKPKVKVRQWNQKHNNKKLKPNVNGLNRKCSIWKWKWMWWLMIVDIDNESENSCHQASLRKVISRWGQGTGYWVMVQVKVQGIRSWYKSRFRV